MKDSVAKPGKPARLPLLAVSLAAWGFFFAVSLFMRQRYRGVFHQIQMTKLPGLTHFFLKAPLPVFAGLWVIPAFVAILLNVSFEDPRRKRAASAALLAVAVVTYGAFLISILLPKVRPEYTIQ